MFCPKSNLCFVSVLWHIYRICWVMGVATQIKTWRVKKIQRKWMQRRRRSEVGQRESWVLTSYQLTNQSANGFSWANLLLLQTPLHLQLSLLMMILGLFLIPSFLINWSLICTLIPFVVMGIYHLLSLLKELIKMGSVPSSSSLNILLFTAYLCVILMGCLCFVLKIWFLAIFCLLSSSILLVFVYVIWFFFFLFIWLCSCLVRIWLVQNLVFEYYVFIDFLCKILLDEF